MDQFLKLLLMILQKKYQAIKDSKILANPWGGMQKINNSLVLGVIP